MFWCDFVAGWVGGCAGILVGHPFDTLKVRQQAFQHGSLASITLDCLKHEGARGLFKGMLYPMLSAGALNSLFFGVYGVSLRFMTSLRDPTTASKQPSSALTSVKPTNWEIFWAGCAGGAAQLVVACPVDVVKIKLQTQTGLASDKTHYKGPYDCLKSIYNQQGVRGWYKGLVPMAWRDIHSFGIYVVLYNYFLNQCGSESDYCKFIAGGMTGVLSWGAIIYLDVVKSRIQSDDPVNPKYNGMIDTFRKCYREGGIRIFGRDLLPCRYALFH